MEEFKPKRKNNTHFWHRQGRYAAPHPRQITSAPPAGENSTRPRSSTRRPARPAAAEAAQSNPGTDPCLHGPAAAPGNTTLGRVRLPPRAPSAATAPPAAMRPPYEMTPGHPHAYLPAGRPRRGRQKHYAV